MKFYRSHILTIFFSLKKYFWVLLLPVMRAVLLYGMDIENAFAGFGADIAAASLLLLYSIIKRQCTYLSVSDGRVIYKSGLVLKKTVELSFSEISCIRLSQTPFTALFGCRKAAIYTEAQKKPAIVFYADSRTAALLVARRGRTVLRAGAKQNLLHSLLNAKGSNGLLKVSAILSTVGLAIGKGVRDVLAENTGLLPETASDIPPLTVIAALALFFGWLVSVAATVVENADFSVKKAPDSAVIRRGILVRRRCVITDDPALMVFSQNFLFGGVSVYAFANGFAEEKEGSPLIPCTGKIRAESAALALCGADAEDRLSVTTRRQPVRYFILAPLCMFGAAVLASAAGVVMGLFGGFNFAAVLLPMPFLWQAFCALHERGSSGVTENGGMITAVYQIRSKQRTAVFSKDRCGKITLSQNPFQRRTDRCNLRFYLPAAGKEKIKLRQLPCSQYNFLCKIQK
ncbi:MAG: PH domain-containing protein [Eubacterium sp.]|nr:PH domain-containing protein [Eubacterium sp.]